MNAQEKDLYLSFFYDRFIGSQRLSPRDATITIEEVENQLNQEAHTEIVLLIAQVSENHDRYRKKRKLSVQEPSPSTINFLDDIKLKRLLRTVYNKLYHSVKCAFQKILIRWELY